MPLALGEHVLCRAKYNVLYFAKVITPAFVRLSGTHHRKEPLIMAHLLKCKTTSASHILGHCFREKHDGIFLKYRTSSEIDPERTELNRYVTASGGELQPCSRGTAFRKLKDRMDEIGVKRKDQVVMADWIFTVPKTLDLTYEQQIELLADFCCFVSDRYGEDNFISGALHFDETTPHVHCSFTPVKDGRFQAKNILNLRDMKNFHKDFFDYLSGKDLSFTITLEDILNGKTVGVETVADLKAKTVSDLLDIEIPSGKQNLTGKTVFTPEEYDSVSEDIKSLKSKISALDANLDAAHKRIQSSAEEILRQKQALEEKDAELSEVKLENRLLKAKADPDRYEAVEVPAEWCHESRFNLRDNIKQCFVRGFSFDIYERIGSRIRLFIDRLREYTQHKESQDFTMSGSRAAAQLRNDVREYDDLQTEKERKRQERQQRISRKPRQRDYDFER